MFNNHGINIELEAANTRAFGSPLRNISMPRWQRKALEQQQQQQKSSSTTTPVKSTMNTNTNSTSTTPKADRFIPNRMAMDLEASHFNLIAKDSLDSLLGSGSEDLSPNRMKYREEMNAGLFDGVESKILAFKEKAPAPREGHQNTLKVLYSQNKVNTRPTKPTRTIPQKPVRNLDAPEMLDDYYLNLLDWSQNNILAVALGKSVYLWNADTGSVNELCKTEEEEDYITCVNWSNDGNFLTVATSKSEVQLWDVEREKKIRTLRSHTSRVGACSWNEHILSSGCKDGSIHNSDVRIQQYHINAFVGHTQEVCGLKWSPDGSLLASGANDNLVNIWDSRYSQTNPKFTMADHSAAVKALAWCPWQNNLLATGGGSADRHIRLWNTLDGSCVNAVDTKSQVCAIAWSKEYKELVSSHGYPHNQLTLWKYPTMTRIADLTGHTSRVLQLSISPDGQHVASASGDESIRIWKCFESAPKVTKVKVAAPFTTTAQNHSGLTIR